MAKRQYATKAETAKRDPEILRLRAEGLYPADIAERLGLTGQVVKAVLLHSGRAMTPEELAAPAYIAWLRARQAARTEARMQAQGGRVRDRIVALKAKGYSIGLIAQAMGMPRRATVAEHLNHAKRLAAKTKEQP